MSNEIRLDHNTPALAVYAHLWNAAGQVLTVSGATFGAYATASIAGYKIALTQAGTASAYYLANFPALAAGVYDLVYFEQAGASPAETDAKIGSERVYWTGTAIVPLGSPAQNASAVRTELAVELGRVDASVSTRLAATAYTAPLDATQTEAAAAAAIADYAPAQPGDAMTLTSGERTAVANEVEAQIIDDTDSEKVLKAITDKIAAVNPSLDGLTLAAIAAAIRTELAPELARIDATMSSRLADEDYTAPLDSTQTQAAAAAAIEDFRPPTRAEATSDKNEILAAVAELNTGAGTGARTVTITVTDGTDPIEGARVRLTHALQSYLLMTNVDGQAVFSVDDATWQVTITKPLFTLAPSTLVVDGDETRSFEMVRIALPAPEDELQTTAFMTTYDGHGNVAAGVDVAFRVVKSSGEAGRGYLSDSVQATSDESGLLTVALLKNTRYRVTQGKVPAYFTTDDSDSFAIPELVGLAD